ncbi:hypothetical protein PHMEG_00022247 [Phytophthora megakarya]|uniref:Uncharacterized protein n=1 Tax=Phytophthora megakarya TaxID=4795 RepID=A0A225VKU5_9STRA|nr:hypothetical protein PHMEG_00022247 [Phytophthora megakarya]
MTKNQVGWTWRINSINPEYYGTADSIEVVAWEQTRGFAIQSTPKHRTTT